MSENEMFISFKFNTTSIQNLFLEDHKKKSVYYLAYIMYVFFCISFLLELPSVMIYNLGFRCT